ncbi:MAG: GEVED domain-containing protein [Candidatus Nanohalobium sp.]
MRKGLYFSLDAVLALTVMTASMILVLQVSQSNSNSFQAETSEFRQISSTGRDAMKLAANQDVNTLNDSMKNYLRPEIGEEAMNKSILNAVSLLWAKENFTAAEKLAKNYLGSKIPEGLEYAVNITESGRTYSIYRSKRLKGAPSVVTSTSTLVSGHKIERNQTGIRARALLTKVDKNATKRRFFGGFVGQGLLRYNVSLNNPDEVKNFTLRGDFSGPFNLSVNGVDAGSYGYSPENLTVDFHQVCTAKVNVSRCEAFQPGDNNITFNFTGVNKSVRGGVLEIVYNKTKKVKALGGDSIVKKKRLPGIHGIINYYGSFYVPGDFNGMNARLHVNASDQNLFMRVGNVTVYNQKVDGEQVIEIDNETFADSFQSRIIQYQDLQGTVPLRIGIGDISEIGGYREAVADSVAVMDVSGSMDCSWGESPPCKIDEAKNASKEFVDIILNGTGNRAGFVSYSDAVVDNHPLSTDNESLKNMIESQTAGGATCIGCGILNATETLLDLQKERKISRGSTWRYTNSYLDSRPPNQDGRSWNELGYDDSSWSLGTARIGSDPSASTVLSSYEGSVYLRKEFKLNNTAYWNGTVYINSNGAATVYVNGQLVQNDTKRHRGSYWNREPSFDEGLLRRGKNVVAVKLKNEENDSKHWKKDSNTEWGQGSFTGTEAVDSNLTLERVFGTGQDVDASQYCSVSGGSTYYEWIENVAVHGVDRTSGDNGGYLDATDSVTNPLVPGRSYRINVTFGVSGGYTEYATVAFDWDGDNSISDDSVVQIGSCTGDGCTVTTTFTVPETASEGSTLMRVMGEFNQYHMDPCSNPTYNEIEDYSAFVDSPSYQNGSYTSQQFTAPETVNWSKAYIDAETGEDTSIDVNFTAGTDWHDEISQVPNSDTLRYKAFLNTTNESKTPRVDSIDVSYLADSRASFDLELNLTEERRRSMIVMSDGAANVETSMTNVPDHNGDGVVDASDHAIEAACRANQNHNVTVYTVGFGSDADTETLNQTAICGGGEYYHAAETELKAVFENISERILAASYVGQTVEKGDDTPESHLYADSYIDINYSDREGLEYGKINLKMTSETFGGKVESPKEEEIEIPNGTAFAVPEGTEVEEAKVSSYSGNKWTYLVKLNSTGSYETVFNLMNYGTNFQDIGDPFKVGLPEGKTRVGVNEVKVDTAIDPRETTGGSPDNRVFYTLQFSNSVGYGALFNTTERAQQDARKRLEQKLDFDGDGEPIVDFSSDDFSYNSELLGNEPYLWGPANVKLVIWRDE